MDIQLLLDDDAEAMSILCGVLHHRSPTEYPNPATLVKVALVTDKYDCSNSNVTLESISTSESLS